MNSHNHQNKYFEVSEKKKKLSDWYSNNKEQMRTISIFSGANTKTQFSEVKIDFETLERE